MMRIKFVDGSEVEHVLAVRAWEGDGKVQFLTVEGDVIAEFEKGDVASYEVCP